MKCEKISTDLREAREEPEAIFEVESVFHVPRAEAERIEGDRE